MTVISQTSIFVPMAKKELSGPEQEAQRLQREAQLHHDTEILRIAAQYIELMKQAVIQAKEWLPDVELRHLSGSEESAYLKKKGHRPLTKGDLTTLILLYGDADQKQTVESFKVAQGDVSKRLEGMSNLGLLLSQAEVNYNTYYIRRKDPERWKAEEIINIMNVLERLKL